MVYTFPNGVKVEGTVDQVKQAAKAFGYNFEMHGYYNSSSRGLVRITEMDTRHIRNAMFAKYRDWFNGLGGKTDLDLAKSLVDAGPNDREFTELYAEFVKRTLGVNL